MTENQKLFLELAVIKQVKYSEINKTLGIDQKTLSKWWDELKEERIKLSDLRKIWSKKNKSVDFWDFKKWFDSAERKCYYCEITEPDLKRLIDIKLIGTKRLTTRGRKLEIERILPNNSYDDLSNLVFCCYWCNNAKTDEFTAEEFKPIGLAIKKIWKNRLERADHLEKRQERFIGDITDITIIKKE